MLGVLEYGESFDSCITDTLTLCRFKNSPNFRQLGAPRVQSCCTVSISASYHVFVYGRYRKSRLVCVLFSDLDLFDITRLY